MAFFCARGGSVGGGWDDGGSGECCGVIEDDAPAFGKFSEVQGEDAGGLVGFADQVEFSYYVGGVGAGEVNFKIGERDGAHGFAIGIGVVVAIEHRLPAVRDAVGAEEFGLLGIPVAGHEGVDVAAIPGGGLHVQDGADLGFVGWIRGGGDGGTRDYRQPDCCGYRGESCDAKFCGHFVTLLNWTDANLFEQRAGGSETRPYKNRPTTKCELPVRRRATGKLADAAEFLRGTGYQRIGRGAT